MTTIHTHHLSFTKLPILVYSFSFNAKPQNPLALLTEKSFCGPKERRTTVHCLTSFQSQVFSSVMRKVLFHLCDLCFKGPTLFLPRPNM